MAIRRRTRPARMGRWHLWRHAPHAGSRTPDEASLQNPGRWVVLAFLLLVGIGAVLLVMPWAKAGPGGASPTAALFTATSAVTVTGLGVVDTATYWSGLGKLVIGVLVQLGGFGIIATTTLLAALIGRRVGLRGSQRAETEAGHIRDTGEFRVRSVVGLLRLLLRYTLVVEGTATVLLAWRFWQAYGYEPVDALLNGLFHAVTSFNNAGFALFSDNLMGFTTDWMFCFVINLSVILGGIGFPVLVELRHRLTRPNQWALHTRIMTTWTAFLLVFGTISFLFTEWTNDGTLGPLSLWGKTVAAVTAAVQPRTAGFNTLDYAEMRESTWLLTDVLMFIGGGSTSTAGGVKITTIVVLLLVVLSAARGATDITGFGRQIPGAPIREALVIVLLFLSLNLVGTAILLSDNDYGLGRSLFEVVSALSTVGLSTGITADLGALSQFTLIALMFIGRVGPATLATALALRHRPLRYHLPEETPPVG